MSKHSCPTLSTCLCVVVILFERLLAEVAAADPLTVLQLLRDELHERLLADAAVCQCCL